MLLSAEGLVVNRGSRQVVSNVSIEIAEGEVLGVFGPSGAGKTTLFRVLAGEETPRSGRVVFLGQDVTRLPLWRRARLGVGYLPQTPSVLWDLTVTENLEAFAVLSTPRSTLDLKGIAADLGLAERGGVKASALSGGERRRLELVRTLTTSPRLLLCDEPFAALDPKGADLVAARLKDLAKGGAGVVLADHHLGVALSICDRACLLVEGEILAERPPTDFTGDDFVKRHYAPGQHGF